MKVLKRELVFNEFVQVERLTIEGLPFTPKVVRATNSVAFLVHNTDTDEFLFTIQDRAPMIDITTPSGELMEAAAGRFDVAKGVNGLILQELQQELGVTATEDQIVHINGGENLALSPGVLTEMQWLAYVPVTTAQIDPAKKLYGERSEGERIARRFVPASDLINGNLEIRDMKTFALVQWYVAQVARGLLRVKRAESDGLVDANGNLNRAVSSAEV